MAYELESGEPVNFYPELVLRHFTTEMLLALGATSEEAEVVTDGLITASLWWHPAQGQGLDKLFGYYEQIRTGGIVPNAVMAWEREGPSSALLDAAKGFGYVAAHRAMKCAIAKARQTGIAIVGVRQSNHFGIAGYHASLAARQGLIGLAMTNAAAEMAPWGSAKPVLGTNPWGIAIPRREKPAIILDMALTMSGKGMIGWYERAGKSVPDTWALTADGRRTTEPAAAMDGPLLPIGAYKGYGLSLITDVLTGVMTGALFGLSVFQDARHYNVGHALIAIYPEAFMARAEFEERLEQLLADVKAAPAIDPSQPVLFPGEAEHRRMETRRLEGIPVERETVAGLQALAFNLGVACPL